MQYPILDYELEPLKNVVGIVDQHLARIIKESMEVDDADSFGYFDNAEHITGLGFVACQTYMSSVCGNLKIDKQKALSIGPFHSSGQTKVQIINHAANYWKHSNEWSFEKNDKRRKYVENSFELVGFPVDTDYPLSGILTEVVFPEYASFQPIVIFLETWRNELYKLFPKAKGNK
jgi:hypothetical protein